MAEKDKAVVIEVLKWLEVIAMAIGPITELIDTLKAGGDVTDEELETSREKRLAAFEHVMEQE